MKMLIAEDNRVSRTMLEKLLSLEGYDVLSASNGEEALDIFTKETPDMAFVDWMMPKMDGIELTKKIRELESPKQKPVYIIMITARSTKDDMMTALSAGVNDFVSKPFDRKVLMSRIKVGERVRKERSTNTINILTDEHEDLLKLTKILEVVSKSLAKGPVPPRVLEWCGSTAMLFDAATHHQKDNYYIMVFLDRMLKVHGENTKARLFSKSSLKQVEEEHKELESLLNQLNEGFLALSRGTQIDVRGLMDVISRYVELQKHHLEREERFFFPLTYKYLEDEDIAELLQRFDDIDKKIGTETIERRKRQMARAAEIFKIK